MAAGILAHSPRVAICARVSTTNSQDPSLQTRELKEYCFHRGWQLAGEYIDLGISGSKEKRPALDRLMADAHRRRFRCGRGLEVRSVCAIGFASSSSVGNIHWALNLFHSPSS